MEAHSSYRSPDWTPKRLMFHQNLESFAERVGLLVGLQSVEAEAEDHGERLALLEAKVDRLAAVEAQIGRLGLRLVLPHESCGCGDGME